MMIKELEVKDLHTVAKWLYRMNEQDHHYVAWLASDPNEIFEQIWTLTQFHEPLAYVAWDQNEIIGFLGILPFFEEKLCRLLGPFSSSSHEQVIEGLWDKASLTIQLHFNFVKVACFESNTQLVDFAERHSFDLYNVEKTLAVHKSMYEPSTQKSESIVNIQHEDLPGLDRLHPDAAYYTTGEMLKLSKEHGNHLWGYQTDGDIAGYIYFETIIPDYEGEICFVNVKSGERGTGIGSALIEHALQYAFHALNLDVVTISVRVQNEDAENLYKYYGFRDVNTIHAYQKEIQKQPLRNTFH
ncbi:GNAT family N-acetyltransferase [Halobacillus yeomjeoni]|uniref:GNAT family N-acetyltransferase n=1 Tax=Halobacillus yeomjeoni TaxID=311194 RepID=UPI001CD53C0C|nr:N-acetyltransferase [Halobacillus yeomjeoni]MCA0985410.1 GNAT family N-acetyltransferase [Halobacillus yeomjeoni]